MLKLTKIMTNLRKITALFVLCSFFYQTTFAQMVMAPAPETRLRAGNQVVDVYIPPDPSLMSGIDSRDVQIMVNYIGDDWTNEQRAAFDYAKGLWAQMLTSSNGTSITIDAEIDYLDDDNTLAVAKAGRVVADFGSSNPAYQPNTMYPLALANRLYGDDLTDIAADIEVTISRQSIEMEEFYYGIDGECPDDKYDFVTTVLHEIGHSIGFSPSPDGNGVEARYGISVGGTWFPTIADRFVIDGNMESLTDYTVGEISTALNDYFESDSLFWRSPTSGPKLYAPSMYEDGASVAHLDTIYEDTDNALFCHDLGLSEAIHSPGPIRYRNTQGYWLGSSINYGN